VEAILKAQAPRAARLNAADDIIHNDTNMSAVRDQVAALHARYLEFAARANP
jgi:dephospho-CoA kinase